MASKTVPVLNPAKVKWRDITRALGPQRARPVWQQIQAARKASHNPVKFRVFRAPQTKPKEATMPVKQELEKMPAEWRGKWAKGLRAYVERAVAQAMRMPAEWKGALKKGVAKARGGHMPSAWVGAWKRGVAAMQPMMMPAEWKEHLRAGVAGATGGEMPPEWVEAWKHGVAAMQPMAMPHEWRERWAKGVLARGAVSPLARAAERKWTAGVRKYALEQPVGEDVIEGVKEIFTAEGIADLVGVTGGITAGSVAPAYLLSLLKVEPSTTKETLAGVAVAIAGSGILGAIGQLRMGRLFMYSTLGTLAARMLLEKLMPAPTAGVGDVKAETEAAIKKALEKALKEEGLGALTTEQIPLKGGVGVISTEARELGDLGAEPLSVEPF